MMETVHIPLTGRSYDVRIGQGLIESVGDHVQSLLNRDKLTVVTERRLEAEGHLASLVAAFKAIGIATDVLVLPEGEGTKDWGNLGRVVEWLLEKDVERNDVVVAFGGGVIGDLVGFAAAILRRGVRFIQMPTTLLAQVDSSVGGKTGINSPKGKNLIGAFHQPALVLADLDVLDSLSDRDIRAGYGEVMKYGLLGDAAFFEWLEENAHAVLAGDKSAQMYAVRRSVEMKAEIVLEDETELGRRALLNLGHTFCHALEAATGYSDRLLHGEGVAIGCGLAFELSARLGLAPQEDAGRIYAHCESLGLLGKISQISGDLPDAEAIYTLMGQDKKVRDGAIRFVLAKGIGQAFQSDGVEKEAVVTLLKDHLGH